MNELENTPLRSSAHRDGPDAGYEALKRGAAVVDRLDRVVLRLTGEGAVAMLNAVLTNLVPEGGGLGIYAALLNPKGRVQTDLRVLKAGGEVFVDAEPEGADATRETLGRYAPFSRVKIEDLTPSWGILGLYGPRATELLGGLRFAEHESARVKMGGTEVLAAGVAAPVAGFDLVGPMGALHIVKQDLIGTGAEPASLEAYETARVEAGIPRFGSDITPENFPGESGVFQERAVSFGKGCYPGQETVARMRYRGHPNKNLYRFELEATAEPAKPGDEVLQGEEKAIGWISSVAPLPVDDRVFVLGYLSRKADPEAPMRTEDARVLALRLA